jgi:hypothetical protein
MDAKIITVEDYLYLIKKLDSIEKVVWDKIKPQKQFFTSEELCKLLSISKRTLQSWRDGSLISYKKVNGIIFYSVEDINGLLQRNQVEAKISAKV